MGPNLDPTMSSFSGRILEPHQEQLDSSSSEVEPPQVDFSQVEDAPPEVSPVLVLLVGARVEEVDVAAGQTKMKS